MPQLSQVFQSKKKLAENINGDNSYLIDRYNSLINTDPESFFEGIKSVDPTDGEGYTAESFISDLGENIDWEEFLSDPQTHSITDAYELGEWIASYFLNDDWN